MKIGFDAKRAYNNSRGLGTYSREVIRLMSSFYPENEYFMYNPVAKSKINYIAPSKCVEVNPTSFTHKLFPSLWRSNGMIKDLKNQNIDIYHGLSQELPYGVHKSKIKSVVTVHDAIFMRYPELYSPIYRHIFIKKNKYALSKADVIIAISEQTKTDIINYFGADESRIQIVYQGCNNIYRTAISEGLKQKIKNKYKLPSEYLLTVGAIERRKNAEVIVKAMAHQSIDIPLVIVGKPTKYMEHLKELIHRLDLENRVLFLHDVGTEELHAIYHLAKIFVFPSLFEGFGIPILEAMCSGTPVICSSGTCFEEVGGSHTKYVNPNDYEQLGETIMQLLQSVALRENMVQHGLLFSEKFTDQRVANSLMKVYSSIQ
jgi:glycosyltransferase involved in cell wall biosynthesis